MIQIRIVFINVWICAKLCNRHHHCSVYPVWFRLVRVWFTNLIPKELNVNSPRGLGGKMTNKPPINSEGVE